MEVGSKLPSYVKFYFKLLITCTLVFIFYITKSIVLPIIFSILLAIILLRLNSFLERKGLPRSIAIVFSLIIAVLIMAGIIYFLSAQVANFTDDMGGIQEKLGDDIQKFQGWISQTFHLTIGEQKNYVNKMISNLKEGGYIGKTFLTITQELIVLILIPVYTFLILYYRDKIRNFLISVFQKTRDSKITKILNQSKGMIEGYMLGLLIEMVIVAILISLGLMIIGVRFAIFLGVLAAILNVIPYVGILVAGVFTLFISMGTSKELGDLIWIAILYLIVHNIDSNILKTIIVGSHVRINALVTIVGIVVGNALCGIAGMFLAIPGLAIFKIICDRVESLKPWGALLGEPEKKAGETKLLTKVKRTMGVKNRNEKDPLE